VTRTTTALVVGAALLLIVAPRAAEASPNGSCFACHARVAFDPPRFAASVHGELACGDCHPDFHNNPHGQAEVPPVEPEWLATIVAAESRTGGGVAWGSCGSCHAEVIEEMALSRHIVPSLESGSEDGAFCRDCHGPPHYIQAAPHSPHERVVFVHDTCVPCHSDPALIERWGLNPDVVFTYEESIHGRAARLGSAHAPTCVSCHQAHAVQSGKHPDSPLSPDHRAGVCGQCHAGANDTFASVFSHTRLTRESRPADWWATFFFVSLTVGTIALLMLHMLLDFIAGLRDAVRQRRRL
jgi:hypothetical protein